MSKILIVDDAGFARFMIGKIIKETGHEIIEAENGRIGLEKIESERPDLVITDLLMPEVDGVMLLAELKKKKNAVPVVVMSSNIQETMRQKCHELGAAGFINKPPQKDVLLKLVNQILG